MKTASSCNRYATSLARLSIKGDRTQGRISQTGRPGSQCVLRSVPDNGRVNKTEAAQSTADEEKTLSLSDFLKDCPEDFIFRDVEETEAGDWDHEDRFRIDPPSGNAPVKQVKGALDPTQADILSAYSSEQGFREESVQQLEEALSQDSSLRVLDVRTAEEYERGHVPGAVNVELGKLTAQTLDNLGFEKTAGLHVICASGKRSAQACVRLSKVFGFQDVTNVKGGTLEWMNSGRETDN